MNISIKTFIRIIATMNFIAIVRFFEIIYYYIFKYLLATSFKDKSFLGFISTYFGIIETNIRGILYLHCLVWLFDTLCIT